MRFKKIDDLTRSDHYYLTESDSCLYLGEYTPGLGYAHSPTNQRIYNLKKSVSLKGQSSYSWKNREIEASATDIRNAFNWADPGLSRVTWVPVPPSKAKTDVNYDDRMLQILFKMSAGLNVDIRELVIQQTSLEASHSRVDRPKPQELADNYRINMACESPCPEFIFIVDDVLTAGSHFKAMQIVLERHFPGVRTAGVFLARTQRG